MILTSTEESRKLDEMAMKDYGIPEMVLMENAGSSVIRLMSPYVDWRGAYTVVVCGTGNNGGDGFVAARYADEMGARVVVLIMGDESHMSESTRMYRSVAEKMGLPVYPVTSLRDAAIFLYNADIIIDALIGTGLSKRVTGDKAEVIYLMNKAKGLVISIDMPSGLRSDTGEAEGHVVRADFTVALGSVKRGHVLYPGTLYTGHLLCFTIGIPEAARWNFPVHLTESEDVCHFLPERDQISHKGKNGFIGIFAGSDGMEGAALLAGQAALYGGAGKVSLVTTREASKILAGKVPELMVSSIGDAPYFTKKDSMAALKKAEAYDVIAIGPGLGRDEETQQFVEDVVTSWDKPMVIDADAIYALRERNISLTSLKGLAILTPHVGEFAHLTGLSPKEIEGRRIDVATEFAVKNKVVLVLKGAPTVVAMPDGTSWVNTTGNPGMAAGGMGDTLTGVIAALLGQMKEGDQDAKSRMAVCGVYLHGLAGDLAAEKTAIGYRASDVACLISEAREKVMNFMKGDPELED